MEVPILKQGSYLIASIQSALTDADLTQLRDALVARVGRFRCARRDRRRHRARRDGLVRGPHDQLASRT